MLGESWNMVSANVDPLNDDVRELMTSLVEAENLIIIKTGMAGFMSRNTILITFRAGSAVKVTN